MYKLFALMATGVLLNLMMACGTSNDEKSTDLTTTTAAPAENDSDAGEELVDDDVKAPPGFTFAQKDFEGLGMMQLPSGPDWTVEDKTYYNEKLDMTVKIQTQAEGFMDEYKEYTDSYYDNNLRDAKDYHQTSRTFGQLSGYRGVIMAGEFNNGQPYVTKDFLFFTPSQCTVLQVRINEKDKDKLEPVADYIVSSLDK